MRINIGSGRTRLPGYTNVDILPWADLQCDLDKRPWPLEDNCAEVVFSYGTLEHLKDWLGTVAELHRILKPGGWLLVGLPYATSTVYNLVNPYHRHHHFSEHSFDFFDPRRLQGSAMEPDPPAFYSAFYELHWMPGFSQLEDREWCRRHYLNVVRSVDIGAVAITGAGYPEPSEETVAAMREELHRCVAARVPQERAL